MIRPLVAITVAALFAAPAVAGNYSARPVAAPAQSKIIGKDISWNCGPDSCLGSTEASRPAIICQDLAKRAGRLESFSVDGRSLGAAELERCNGAARGQAPALARAD